ncbi:MAG: alanine--tRNA ligase, partial [Gammaproteobacteria bacterium]|nr:alanine--tRNA ligase [Gammaproteobacteria bacterium]
AIRHGYQLGQTQPFFHRLVPVLVDQMGAAYPELVVGRDLAMRALRQEEERFAETLTTGMALLDSAIAGLAGKTIPGETVFKLYDTYGFPVDLTADIARERGLTVDTAGFEAAMEAQRDRARAASKFGVDLREAVKLEQKTGFCGYESLEGEGVVVALVRDGQQVDSLAAGEAGQVVLDVTPFYAESGGQAGDAGTLARAGASFEVKDTRKIGQAFAHVGVLLVGGIKVGDRLVARVDAERREATALNHTATHLLHAALRKVLGSHVQQKGSLVEADRLRFDFAHFQAMTAEELAQVERLVNAQVRANAAAETKVMGYDEAVATGAMALFGEKYDSQVRVLRVGDFSVELCGGTHVRRAGDIGLVKIVSEGGVAAGVRRIEAVTGEGALEAIEAAEQVLRQVAGLVRGTPADLEDKVRQLLDRQKKLEKDIAGLKQKLASGQGVDLASSAQDIGGIKLVAAQVEGADAQALREAVDQLKGKLGSAVIVLGAPLGDGKVTLVAGVTADLVGRFKAGEIVGMVAAQVGGKGGGRPDFAQAGGSQPEKLEAAIAGVAGWVRSRL